MVLRYSSVTKTVGKFVGSKVWLTNAKQNKNDNFLFDIGLIFNKTFLNGLHLNLAFYEKSFKTTILFKLSTIYKNLQLNA